MNENIERLIAFLRHFVGGPWFAYNKTAFQYRQTSLWLMDERQLEKLICTPICFGHAGTRAGVRLSIVVVFPKLPIFCAIRTQFHVQFGQAH
jgi:hypothetical protein